MVMTDYIIPGALKLKYELDKDKKLLPTVIHDLRSYLCTLTSGKSPIKNDIIKLLSVDSELITEILHDNKQIKQHKQPGTENGLDDSDDDDDEDDEIHLIEDLEYVTWAQIMEMRDQAEESGFDESVQVQMQEELHQKVSEISFAEDGVQDEAVANFSQLTGEIVQPIKRERNVSNVECKQRKLSKINDESQLINENPILQTTNLEDDNLPGYKLFD